MTIFRVRKDTRYFVASNELFNDKRLTLEARGLMGYLLSKPDGWEVRMADIEGCSPAGRDRVRRIVKELCTYGYMYREAVHSDAGTWQWVTEVYESPSANPNPWQTTDVALEYRSDDPQEDDDPPEGGGGGPGPALAQDAVPTADEKPVAGGSDGLTVDGKPVSGGPVDILSTELVSTDKERYIGERVYTFSEPDPGPPGDDAVVFQKLAELMGGGLNPSVTRYVDAWLEKHKLEWVLKAISEAAARGARSERYVDRILIGWEANGYPKTRDEQVLAAKRAPSPSRLADQKKAAMTEEEKLRFREEQRQKNREQAAKIARQTAGKPPG